MKTLFICSGDKFGNPKIVVKNQGLSLENNGVTLEYFCVTGGGILNYFKALPKLKQKIKTFKPDIIHALYSYSGFLAFLAGARPLVISLMGSDAMKKGVLRFFTRQLSIRYSNLTIAKSIEMKLKLNLPDAIVIPNGVDTELFKPLDKDKCIQKTNLDSSKKNILFVSAPARAEKNYPLAEKAVKMAHSNNNNINLVVLNNIPHSDLVWYYNSADLLLLTSKWEGSPNVVKEAMACNLPVVSTDVGDVGELLMGVENSTVCLDNPSDISRCICETIDKGEKSNGRNRIFQLGIDSTSIAVIIKNKYLKILELNEG